MSLSNSIIPIFFPGLCFLHGFGDRHGLPTFRSGVQSRPTHRTRHRGLVWVAKIRLFFPGSRQAAGYFLPGNNFSTRNFTKTKKPKNLVFWSLLSNMPLRHSPKGSCPGYQGHAWPITCPRSWDRLTEHRVPPNQPLVSPVNRLALHRECRWSAAVTVTFWLA